MSVSPAAPPPPPQDGDVEMSDSTTTTASAAADALAVPAGPPTSTTQQPNRNPSPSPSLVNTPTTTNTTSAAALATAIATSAGVVEAALLDPSSASTSTSNIRATAPPLTTKREPNPSATLPKQSLLIKREDEEKKKDRSLAELLGMLDGYRPVIPDEVTEYYLQKSGFQSHDPRLNRLLSISAEKFISDIVSDAYQYSRIRSNATSGRPPTNNNNNNSSNATASGGSGGVTGAAAAAAAGTSAGDRSKTVLTLDDLTAALGEYGVNAKRADSYR